MVTVEKISEIQMHCRLQWTDDPDMLHVETGRCREKGARKRATRDRLSVGKRLERVPGITQCAWLQRWLGRWGFGNLRESQGIGVEWRHSECDLENVPRALDRAVTRTEELEKFPKPQISLRSVTGTMIGKLQLKRHTLT